jgi:predicted ATPase
LRLTKVKINGFGRIAKGSIDLVPRVVAIVGPNEAGKSTLLDALFYLTDRDAPLPLNRRSRTARPEDNTTVVSGIYVLEKHETASFLDLELEHLPKMVTVSRHAGNTTRYINIDPPVERSKIGTVERASAVIREVNKIEFRSDSSDVDLDIEAKMEAAERREVASARVESVLTALYKAEKADEVTAELPNLRAELLATRQDAEILTASTEVVSAIDGLLEWIDTEKIEAKVRERVSKLVPTALLFAESDRNLPSSFVINDETLTNVPSSVQNLADMAGLSLDQLWNELQSGDRAAHGTSIRRANNQLKAKFNLSWRQSNLSVAFDLVESTLYIEILQDDDLVTPIDERSAGLRMYVALAAFLERIPADVPPILLIDEAENHLHLDAQADLVASFSRQSQVAKIVYTTHSPGCLPADLGTNVRAVLPNSANAQESTLENSFWRNASGFTPLMIAMGAGASAFSAARFVVLAEGATEMLIAPSLIRAATGLSELPYQIAPGLSESSPEDYVGLDLEGARVAFLVDGDAGGQTLKRALLEAGIADKKIAVLGTLTLEHLLDGEIYRSAYAQLLGEWNPLVSISAVPDFDDASGLPRPRQLDNWAKRQPGLTVPGKRDVASYLAEHGKAIPSTDSVEVLKALHSRLIDALGVRTVKTK